MIATYLQSLAGGMLLGLSAVLLLVFNGRIAGISGIVGRLSTLQSMAPFLRSRWPCHGPSSSWQGFWSVSEPAWVRAAPPAMAFSAWHGFPNVR